MLILLGFAFLAGVVTILSPCILPVLPVVLAASADGLGKRKPWGVILGFVGSFTFFTLFLSTLVKTLGIPADLFRWLAIAGLIVFGLSQVIEPLKTGIELLLGKMTGRVHLNQNRTGFTGGLLIGIVIGLVWVPCVGPILASVIVLALSGMVTWQSLGITLAYSAGTAVPMYLLMRTGRGLGKSSPWLLKNSEKIQKAFGVVMIVTGLGLFVNLDRKFQSYILNAFPGYGAGLTKIEDNVLLKKELNVMNTKGTTAPELVLGGQWFNSKPLTLSELKGKVVLVDFWTYTCINCQRTFPYLRQWWEKYKDKGLVIIGVHAPEFEFEKDPKNLAAAIADFQLQYPIMQDNNFATWRAYKNQYWPAKYFVDKDGVIRYTHFGEGEYDQSEEMIQELLKEAGQVNLPQNISNPQYQIFARTPETYLGYARLANFASPENIKPNKIGKYTAPQQLSDNQVAFEGEWLVTEEYANPQTGAFMVLNFNAKQVFLVIKDVGKPAKIRVFLDEKEQEITVDGNRLYEVVNLTTPGKHLLRLEFDDSNSQLYAFTFG